MVVYVLMQYEVYPLEKKGKKNISWVRILPAQEDSARNIFHFQTTPEAQFKTLLGGSGCLWLGKFYFMWETFTMFGMISGFGRHLIAHSSLWLMV